jgi:hypothetical protein
MAMDMSTSRALEFLRKHQPLPADDALERRDIEELDAVRRYLMKSPVVEALDLLLGVFGEGSGFGVYQHIEDAVAAYDRADVVPALCKKLESGGRSVRYWCAQIASGYGDDRLVDPLRVNLAPNDYDLRYAAITALENIGTARAKATLRSWLPNETVEELRGVIREALDD